MKRRNVRTLSLIVVTFTYLLVGAAVFDALEGQHNEDALEALNLMKNNFKLKYNMSEDEYKIIEVGNWIKLTNFNKNFTELECYSKVRA